MRLLIALIATALLPLVASAATTLAPGAYTVAACPVVTPPVTTPPPVITPPPVTTPPVAGTFWLFNAGVFKGAGDYDFGSGKVTYGQTVVATGDVGYQPRMPNDDFNTTGYTYLTLSIRPTQAGNSWAVGAEMIGDKPFPGCPNMISLMKYGPSQAAVGQWNVYKIPLSAMCITPALHPYKIGILEQSSTNKAGNKVEFDAIGFVP